MLFKKSKKPGELANDYLFSSNVKVFEKSEQRFAELKTKTKSGSYYSVELEHINHPDFGNCLEGKIETFVNNCYIYSDGFYDVQYNIDGKKKFVPAFDGYACFYITTQTETGGFEHYSLLVSCCYSQCQLISMSDRTIEHYNHYIALPDEIDKKWKQEICF